MSISTRSTRQALIGWTFALPFVLLFTVFMAGPIVVSFITSFTDMRVTDIRSTAQRASWSAISASRSSIRASTASSPTAPPMTPAMATGRVASAITSNARPTLVGTAGPDTSVEIFDAGVLAALPAAFR